MLTFSELVHAAPHIIKRKLEQLKFLRERPDYHPEPSAFVHIKIVTERLITTGNPDLILSGILHDIAKFDTVKENPKTGWPTSPGHDDASYDLVTQNEEVRAYCVQHGANPDTVALICKEHMRFHQLSEMKPLKRDKRIQDWQDQGLYDLLTIFGRADNMLIDFPTTETI